MMSDQEVEPTAEPMSESPTMAMADALPKAVMPEPEVFAEQRTAKPVEQQQPHRSVASIIKANPFYTPLKNLCLWRDPIKSGLAFGIVTTSYILLEWFDYTVLSLVSYVEFALLLLCIVYVGAIQMKSSWLKGQAGENPLVAHFSGTSFQVSKESAVRHFDTVFDLYNIGVEQFRAVFFVTRFWRSVGYCIVSYVAAAYVGNWFSGLTLAYLAILVAFSWPRVYEEKKVQIDRLWDTGVTEAKNYFNLAVSKLPPQIRDRLVHEPAVDAAKKRE